VATGQSLREAAALNVAQAPLGLSGWQPHVLGVPAAGCSGGRYDVPAGLSLAGTSLIVQPVLASLVRHATVFSNPTIDLPAGFVVIVKPRRGLVDGKTDVLGDRANPLRSVLDVGLDRDDFPYVRTTDERRTHSGRALAIDKMLTGSIHATIVL
jgi:hypothetical protein